MIAFIDGDPILYQASWGRSHGDAKARVLRLIEETVEATFAKDYLIALGTDDNFRNEFYTLYKKSASRVNSKSHRPEYFDDLKLFLGEQPNVVRTYGFEADDLIRIWSTQADEAGDPYVICSIDKDLDCIAGTHYNSKKNEAYNVTEDEANHFYWKQVLMGDSVDNIPGLPGVGPVRAAAMLEGLTNNEERKELVIQAYKNTYGKQWKEYLLANGRLLHIWRFFNDHFNLD